jgi:hypothetical protein
MFGFGIGKAFNLNKNDKTFLLMKVLGQDPESVAVVFETLQSLYKEIDCWNYFACCQLQERIPVPSMCLKTKKEEMW